MTRPPKVKHVYLLAPSSVIFCWKMEPVELSRKLSFCLPSWGCHLFGNGLRKGLAYAWLEMMPTPCWLPERSSLCCWRLAGKADVDGAGYFEEVGFEESPLPVGLTWVPCSPLWVSADLHGPLGCRVQQMLGAPALRLTHVDSESAHGSGNQLWWVGIVPSSASPRSHLTAYDSHLDISTDDLGRWDFRIPGSLRLP